MNVKERAFVRMVRAYYTRHGRRSLPWRVTRDPYHILISELMLQQTQVERVIPKYKSLLKRFPHVRALAKVRLSEVLKEWQGLGYNRRAKYLHACAQTVVRVHKGVVPKTYEALIALPGVGPYTASAVMVFAYNKAVPLIETNIRTVYIHHFFPSRKKVMDSDLMPLIVKTFDTKNPREWVSALMDYGTHLKETVGNVSRKSAHHVRQPAFKGSDREIRGAILKLIYNDRVRKKDFKKLPFDTHRVAMQREALKREGML